MVYNPELGLLIADTCLLAIYALLLGYEIFVIVKYLIPLKITSPYIVAFYTILTLLLGTLLVGVFCRLVLA